MNAGGMYSIPSKSFIVVALSNLSSIGPIFLSILEGEVGLNSSCVPSFTTTLSKNGDTGFDANATGVGLNTEQDCINRAMVAGNSNDFNLISKLFNSSSVEG
jgi:hypothetical protein